MPAENERTTESTRERLRARVRADARNRPGVYSMLAEDAEVLYVGKSRRIRTRLLSYFRAREGEKAKRILDGASELSWEYEPSEFAALLRELRLIKRFRPRFNVQHKRDGNYSFLKITTPPAPRLLVVQRVADDAATYYGPFRGGRRIREAVRELNDVLGLRDCAVSTPIHFADQAEMFDADRGPRCHRYELQRCAAPCAALCSESEYARRVALARAFLAGNADEPLRWLGERMSAAAAGWNFEHAASLRDRAARLEMLREEFARLREALDHLTFAYTVAGAGGEDRVYLIRRGTVRAELPVPTSAAERRRLDRRAREVFGAPESEGALVERHQVDEILLLARWFRGRPEELGHTAAPASMLAGRSGLAHPLRPCAI